MSNDLSQYVSTRQAAELLGVHRTHINRLLIEKRIKGLKIGSDWLVFKPSLPQYHEMKETRGRPPAKPPKLSLEPK